MNVNPLVGVALIVVGLAACVVFAFYKVPETSAAVAVVTAGIAIATGVSHAAEVKNLRALNGKSSVPPPPLPPRG